MLSAVVLLGTLRSNDATATRTSLKKWILRSFSLNRDYSYPLTLSNAGKPSWSWILRPYPSSQIEIKFRRWLFTFSIKREFRHFHVVVVQKRQGNVQKSVMYVQSCYFANKTYCVLDVLVAVASLDLEIPILSPRYRRYCGSLLWKVRWDKNTEDSN